MVGLNGWLLRLLVVNDRDRQYLVPRFGLHPPCARTFFAPVSNVIGGITASLILFRISNGWQTASIPDSQRGRRVPWLDYSLRSPLAASVAS